MTKDSVSRRRFLQTAGVAAGGFLLAGCDDEDPYALEKPAVPGEDRWYSGEEKWVASVCGQCPAGCGIRVRVVEGRAVKIEGNPVCPINRGGLGPKGQAGLQLLYHPDRVRGPLRRAGPRGSGRWKPATWDEAIAEVGKALTELRNQGDPRSLVVLDGEPRGMVPELWVRFLDAFGSPNHIQHRSTTDGIKVLAMQYMHGVGELPAYDWDSTRYVLSFGANLYESWCQTIHFMRASSLMRRGMPGRRVKLVHVAPRFSVTSAKADEWVAIEPGTYGALALGICHVLIEKELYDKNFVSDHTFGFEDWTDEQGKAHRGFKDLVEKDYPVSKAAAVTGVPAGTIERLALEMVEHRPAISVADGNAGAATNGLGTAMAIHALNALLGNLERPGGMLVQQALPLKPWDEVERDEIAEKGHAGPRIDGVGGPRCPLGIGFIQGLPESILSEQPYPAKALILYRSNPVFSKPDGRRWIETLQKVPLVVSCSPLHDESTLWADFVLPDHTYLERWELVEPIPSVGYPIMGFRQPAVVPLYDTMATGDVILRLAKAMESPMSEAFPWKDYRQATTERLKGLLEVENGSIVASKMGELGKGLTRDGGWHAAGYPFEQWEGAFRTPSGKFEFYSQAIAGKLAEVFPDAAVLEAHLAKAGITSRGDDLCLPHWESPRFAGDAAEYPFILIVYRGINHAEGGVRHLPWLKEVPLDRRKAWKDCVEIHPDDARSEGLREDDLVCVESPAGQRSLSVHLNPGVRPGSLAVALGHGIWPPRPEGKDSPSVMSLLANASEPLAGVLALQGTRARVRKV